MPAPLFPGGPHLLVPLGEGLAQLTRPATRPEAAQSFLGAKKGG